MDYRNIRRRLVGAILPAALAAVVALTPAGAAAQRTVHLGIAGGTAIPVGKTDSTYSAGPMGMVALITGGRTYPIGLRLDYSYNQFRGRTVQGTPHPDLHFNAVTASLVLALPTGYVKPYALVGGGWYPVRDPVDQARHNEFGASGGVGLVFPFFGAAGFIEGRYHKVSGTAGLPERRYVPVALGILL